MRRIFFIFFALLVSFHLFSNPRRAFFTGVQPASFSLFEENGKVGLKNEQGQIVIPAQYEALGWSNGEFSVIDNVTGFLSKGKWGLTNIQNSKITKAEFEDLSPGQGSLLVARKKISGSVKIQSGCISTSGKEIVPFQYDGIRITSFRAIVYVRTGNQFKHGLIDLQNKILVPLQFQAIYPLGSLRYGVVNFENKTAIYSEDGKQITNFLIDSLSNFKKDLAVIYQNQRQGLIDRNGSIKLEPTLREVKINDDGSVEARKSDSWLITDGENKLMGQFNADSVEVVSKNLLKIKTAGKYQLTDGAFKPISENWFDYIGPFGQGKAFFRLRGRTGLMDEKTNVLIKPAYSSLTVDNGVTIGQVFPSNLYVLLDQQGKELTYRQYTFIGKYNGAFWPVKNRGFWGAIDRAGNEIIACTHDSICQQMNGFVVVKFKGNYGVINLKEDWIVTPQRDKITLLNADRYISFNGKTSFLKDYKGNVIYFSDNKIEFKDTHLIEYLSTGSVWKIDLNGLITDRFVRPEAVEVVYPESEGLSAIKKDNRYGFIDNRGRLRIANRYEMVKDFHNGLAAVKIRGKWGFINKSDQIAIQPVYDEVASFTESYSLVKQKELYGLIDKNGKLILPVRYEKIEILAGQKFKVQQNNLWGLAEAGGLMIINPKFEYLEDLSNGYVIVGRDGKYGLITHEGLSTIPQIYDGLSFDAIHDQYIALRRSSWEAVK